MNESKTQQEEQSEEREFTFIMAVSTSAALRREMLATKSQSVQVVSSIIYLFYFLQHAYFTVTHPDDKVG